MSQIQTSLAIPTQPWEAAKSRFLQGLSSQETNLFNDATLENLFYDASAAQKKHAHDSRSWIRQQRLSSLVDAINEYGQAMDVYVNTYGLILSPIWGSVRVVLHVSLWVAKYLPYLLTRETDRRRGRQISGEYCRNAGTNW
jgi:hypothetical protein